MLRAKRRLTQPTQERLRLSLPKPTLAEVKICYEKSYVLRRRFTWDYVMADETLFHCLILEAAATLAQYRERER